MMKLLLSALLLLGAVYAQEGKKYSVGLGYFQGSGDGTVNSSDRDTDMKGYELNFAFMVDKKQRVTLGYAWADVEFPGLHDYTAYNLEYSYLFQGLHKKWTPVVNLGLSKTTYADAFKQYSGSTLIFSADAEGMAYHIGAGAIYSLSNNLELELGLKYKKMDWDQFTFPAPSTSTWKIDQTVLNAHVAVNYLF